MAEVTSLLEYKKRQSSTLVYVGDLVEWQDYDGEIYESKVMGIQHSPFEGVSVGEALESFPLWEKEEYLLMFDHGLSIIGTVVRRKVFPKRKSK